MAKSKELTKKQSQELLQILKERFEKNKSRHKNIQWDKVLTKLENQTAKMWSLYEMEKSGGEPDLVAYDKKTNEYIFFDCSVESPVGRRSVCYDQKALQARKEHKPKNSAMKMAEDMGVELLSEEQYRELQAIGQFDGKTSSWLKTPEKIRKLGGAIFGDLRYATVFVYHNGAESYYAGRGFRTWLKV
jgi:hypothetical protein